MTAHLAARMPALAAALLVAVLGADAGAQGGAVRNLDGFLANAFFPCDDSSPDAVGDQCTPDRFAPQPLGFAVDFFGVQADAVFVNNNGNVTFGAPLFDFTPFPLTTTNRRIIAPFFADVDTRGDVQVVTWGTDVVDGRPAFGVDWVNVGYYLAHSSPTNSFQLVLIDRSDIAAGDFDIEFNYDFLLWDAGDANGGIDGLAQASGTAARAGFSNGTVSFELPGSGEPGALLDTNQLQGLVHGSLGSLQPGRYVFRVRGGRPLPCLNDAQCDDGTGCSSGTCALRAGEVVGECQWVAVGEGAGCDDASPCTEKDVCLAGACVGRPVDCGDGNPCTADGCDAETGCVHAPLEAGAACDDEDGCTEDTTCEPDVCSAARRLCTVTVAGPPERTGKKVRVDCEAEPGSTCEAELRELVEEPAVTAADGSGAGVPQALIDGRAFSKLRSANVRRSGRAVLKLKLNRRGRQALNASADGRLVVKVSSVVVDPRGTRRIQSRLLTFLRRGR